MRIQDYPYEVITEDDSWRLDELEPGAIVIDSESDVLTLKDCLHYGTRRWHCAQDGTCYDRPSLPAIVLVHEFGPDDYPEDWYEMGGEEL